MLIVNHLKKTKTSHTKELWRNGYNRTFKKKVLFKNSIPRLRFELYYDFWFELNPKFHAVYLICITPSIILSIYLRYFFDKCSINASNKQYTK